MKIKNSKFDIGINVTCLVLLVGVVIFLIASWNQLPDQIPMHYNFAGEVDRWGSKSEAIFLPVISWFMFLFLTGVEHFPSIWNTGVKVTEENQERVYRTLKNMIMTLKLIVVCVFVILSLSTICGLSLEVWFTPVFCILIFGDLIFWIVRLMRIK